MRAPKIMFTGWFMGLATTLSQLTLIRELSQWFCGNDMFLGWTLAVWVGGTAWGAGSLGSKFNRLFSGSHLARIVLLGSLHFSLLICLLLFSRSLNGLIPWSMAANQNVTYMFLGVLLLSVPLAASGGLWFASLMPKLPTGTPSNPTSIPSQLTFSAFNVFFWEAIGATSAGLVYTFGLSSHWNPWWVVACLLATWMTFAFETRNALRARIFSVGGILLVIALTLWPGWNAVNQHFTVRQREAGERLASGVTHQGTVALYQQQQTYAFYVQNQCRASFPWPEQNEPAALLTWLWGTPPKNIALIGGHPDFIRALLQQTEVQQLTVLSPEPEADTWFHQNLPNAWQPLFADPRLRCIESDARTFFEAPSNQEFDRILILLPLPETLTLNRFYTFEFMTLLRRHLSAQGIVDYILPYSENVRLSPEQALLQSFWGNLTRTFPTCRVWAGGALHLLATPLPDPNTFSAPTLWPKHLQSAYFTSLQFPVLFDNERSSTLQREWSQSLNRYKNTDMRPLATGYSLLHWLSQQSQALLVLLGLFILVLILLAVHSFRSTVWHTPLLRMGMAGGLGLSTEWIVLAAFQSRRGVVWGELGVLIAMFMAGMALGTWVAQRSSFKHLPSAVYLLWLTCLSALSGFAVYGTFGAWLPTLILLGGSGGGVGAMYVRLQSESNAQPAVAFWSADLLGSAVSAVLTIMVLLPWYGFHAGWILALGVGGTALGFNLWGRLARKPEP